MYFVLWRTKSSETWAVARDMPFAFEEQAEDEMRELLLRNPNLVVAVADAGILHTGEVVPKLFSGVTRCAKVG